MRTRNIRAVTLILPLLVLACNRHDELSQTSAGSSQEKQAIAPSSPDKMQESSPPAAGTMSYSDAPTPPSAASQSAPPAEPSAAESPAIQQSSEPRKGS